MIKTKNTSRVSRASLSDQSAAIYLPFLPSLQGFRDQFDYALVPEWDGADSVAINQAVLIRVNRLLTKYSAASLNYIVEVSPSSDGTLSIIWDDSRGNYIYLGVGPGETMHVYYQLRDGRSWEGVSLASDSILDTNLATALSFIHPFEPEGRPFRDHHSRAGQQYILRAKVA